MNMHKLSTFQVLNALWMLVDTEWNHVNLRGDFKNFSRSTLEGMSLQAPTVDVLFKISVRCWRTASVVS